MHMSWAVSYLNYNTRISPKNSFPNQKQNSENNNTCFYDLFFSLLNGLPHTYMISGTRDNTPPPQITLSSVHMWKRSPCRPSQSWLCMIIHNLCFIIKWTIIPLFWVSLGHSITMGFAEFIFTFLIRISSLFPNLGITWHSPRRKLSRLGEPKRSFEEKLSRLLGLPYLPMRDNSRTRADSLPRRVRNPNVNGWLNFAKKYARSYLDQGKPRGGTRDHINGA